MMAEETTKKTQPKESDLMAVVLIRGMIGARQPVKDTLSMLRLRKKHACLVVKNTPHFSGMFNKVKDFVAYGPVAQATVDEIKKARTPAFDEKGSVVFNMAPPKGGFERKGIKKTFVQGGALGKRPQMNTLLKKMM